MVDPDLLSLLCCPETRQGLRQADAPLLEKLNQQITAGSLLNRTGGRVSEKLTGGLIREDGKILYPVRNGIPVMLVDEGISCAEAHFSGTSTT